MDKKCKSCEQSNFTTENCEFICTNCGQVQEDFDDGSTEDNRLCMLPDNSTIAENVNRNKKYESSDRLTNRIRGETNNADARRQINREKLLDDLKKIVKQLIKHSRAVDEAMELIQSTLQAYPGRLLANKKLGLVGACIYYVGAKHQLGISLNDICKVMNIKLKVISTCLKQVRQLSPKFKYQRPNLKDLVSKYINELANKHYDPTLTDNCQSPASNANVNHMKPPSHQDRKPLIDKKDRIVLQDRVMLLIDLFEAMHPYNQPSPQSLIAAVIYHAWKSLDTFKIIAINIQNISKQASSASNNGPSVMKTNNKDHREEGDDEAEYERQQQMQKKLTKVKHSISFEKFCQICNVKYSSNGYKIVTKLQSSLLELGRFLGNVNKINLPWFLKDIIENSPHLIQEHMRMDASQVVADRRSGSPTADTRLVMDETNELIPSTTNSEE